MGPNALTDEHRAFRARWGSVHIAGAAIIGRLS